jgi:MinD-like ATPase involved in chromosome partitioning or flagellar assembly
LLSDLSNAVLIVAQTDVVSLCCAARIHNFLEEGTGRDRVRLVLNRYKKIPGFGDDDVQQTTNCKVLWKVPNAFHVVSHCIDHGTPVVLQEAPEVSRSYRGLAAALAEASNSDGPDLAYGGEGAPKKTTPGRLNLSPIRSGN